MIYFTAKLSKADADDTSTTIQKTSDDGIDVLVAGNGTAVVTLEPEDTEGLTAKTKFFCDVQLVEADGVVSTPSEGTLTITVDVTRTRTP